MVVVVVVGTQGAAKVSVVVGVGMIMEEEAGTEGMVKVKEEAVGTEVDTAGTVKKEVVDTVKEEVVATKVRVEGLMVEVVMAKNMMMMMMR